MPARMLNNPQASSTLPGGSSDNSFVTQIRPLRLSQSNFTTVLSHNSATDFSAAKQLG
jgi:hypothetical protein